MKTFSCHKKLYCIKLLEMNKEEKETWIAMGKVCWAMILIFASFSDFLPLFLIFNQIWKGSVAEEKLLWLHKKR